MKLNTFIKKEIINRAEDILEELIASESSSKVKTAKERAMDAFFAKHNAEPFYMEFMNLMELISGYKPDVKVQLKDFQVMVRNVNGKDCPWIILKSCLYGFSSLNEGYITYANGVDRRATAEETKDFLETFGKLNADELVKWMIARLGQDTLAISFQ